MVSSKGEKAFYAFNYIFLTLVALVMILPLINILAISLSGERAVLSGEVYLWPVEFTLSTYKAVFKGTMLLHSIKNTVVLTLVGTAINMFMTVAAAYPLSKQRLDGRNWILMAITFTMLVNPGVIPNFIMIKNLNLVNSYWAIWLMGAISTFNMIVMKSFFQSIPQSIEEAALIDGCNDLQTLVKIVLPLSLPMMATIALFYAVGYWNSYYNVIVYISSSELSTLQVRLRDLINLSSLSTVKTMMDSAEYNSVAEESMKGAAIIVATVPILAVYPFLQKYFVKGVMIGSIKG